MNSIFKTLVTVTVAAGILGCNTGALAARKATIKAETASSAAAGDITEKETVKVTFADSKGILLETKATKGTFAENIPQADSDGNEIIAWVVNGCRTTSPETVVIDGDTEFAVWMPSAKNTEHITYISGDDSKFRPGDYFTRAELCSVLNKIYQLTDNGCNAVFEDVSSDMWYAEPIAAAAAAGIVEAKQGNSFAPGDYVTRAELVYVLCNDISVDEREAAFADTGEHKAKDYIAAAYENGWITGDEKGLFRPDDMITRAEAVTVINRVMNRRYAASKDMLREANVAPYCDVKTTDWFYADVMEATVTHSYTYTEADENLPSYEIWQSMQIPHTGYGNCVAGIDDVLYFTDSNGQFIFPQGNTFVQCGSSTYYTNSNGTVDTSFSGITNIDGDMYYFCDDHSILKNSSFDRLYFGSDGKYTCGDAQLDSLVDAALEKCTTANMQKWEKLRAAYLYLRDNCKYLSRSHHPRGTDSFVHESAAFMFKNNRGNCYCYASCFLLMARRLGYSDAYVVSGGVGTKNDDHAWVMINGRIFDPELEYAYRYRYKEKKNYNLYDMDLSWVPFPYHFPKGA